MVVLLSGSKVDIQRIEFDQCDDFPCVVHHGQTASGRATMVAQAATDTLTCKVGTVVGTVVRAEKVKYSYLDHWRGGRGGATFQWVSCQRL